MLSQLSSSKKSFADSRLASLLTRQVFLNILRKKFTAKVSRLKLTIDPSDINLATIMIVRQSIGRATLSAQSGENLQVCKETAIENICFLLRVLLPTSGSDRIKGFVTKIVENAISLRNAMTAEQAIYRCFLQHTGDFFDESIAQIANGEQQTGNILICMFPGLRRFTIRSDGKKKFVTVVSARVKLEGVFD